MDKIKTIGSTYMAAVGLIPEFKIADDKEDGGLSAVTYMAQVNIRVSSKAKLSCTMCKNKLKLFPLLLFHVLNSISQF